MSTAEIRQWVKNNMYFNSITGDWEFEEDTDPQELLDLCPDQVDTFEFEDSDIRSSDDYCGVLLGMLGSNIVVSLPFFSIRSMGSKPIPPTIFSLS